MGGGDPGLGDSKIAAASGQTPTSVFEEWAQTLKHAGITQYRQLIIDDRIFDSQWINPDWPANQLLSDDFAPIAGLNFNANCLDWIPKLTNRGVGVDLIPDTSYISVAIKASRGKDSRVSMVRPPTENHFELRGNTRRLRHRSLYPSPSMTLVSGPATSSTTSSPKPASPPLTLPPSAAPPPMNTSPPAQMKATPISSPPIPHPSSPSSNAPTPTPSI